MITERTLKNADYTYGRGWALGRRVRERGRYMFLPLQVPTNYVFESGSLG